MFMRSVLPLNNLHAFAMAADCLSFQGAAERLHVTPSAVSHQVRKLEHLLGYPLFDRLDKRVKLTARGERLFAELAVPFRQIRDASRNAVQANHAPLVISVAPSFATRWLLPRLSAFYADHPHIPVSLMATTEMVQFARDPIDAAIRLGQGHWPGLTAVKLFSTRVVAICRPQLIDQQRQGFAPRELLNLPRVEATTISHWWSGWFASAGVGATIPPAQIQVQNMAQVLEAVQSSDCVGLMDRNLLQADADAGLWSIASSHEWLGTDEYYLVWPESTSASLEAFKTWLLDQAKAINEKGESS